MSRTRRAALIACLIVPVVLVALFVVSGSRGSARGSSVQAAEPAPSTQPNAQLPKRVPVVIPGGGVGYVDRDAVFGGEDWPTARELHGRQGAPITDEAGKHIGWYVPNYGSLTDAEAAKYANGQEPRPSPIVKDDSSDGPPMTNASSGN